MDDGILVSWDRPYNEPQSVHFSMHTVKIIFIQTTMLKIDILPLASASDNADVFFYFF